MSYQVLKEQEQKVFEELVDDMITYTSDSLKGEMGPIGYMLSGMVKVGGAITRGKIKKDAKNGIGFFLEKVELSSRKEYNMDNILEDFEWEFYKTLFSQEDTEEAIRIGRLEASRYELLMNSQGDSYEELYKNAYNTKEEAIEDIEEIYKSQKDFFRRVSLPRWFISKKFTNKLAHGVIDIRREKYLSIIERAFEEY